MGKIIATVQKTIDHRYMSAAIRLANRNTGLTADNPSVGCLLVCNKAQPARIVGTGVTACGGRPHAEVLALAQAKEHANGATAYVTLEPCAHYGVTPPCAEQLIKAGIRRVVTGCSDPDPRVNSKGHSMLRNAGIEVTEKYLANEAINSISGYVTRKILNRPRILLKLAISADGFIGISSDNKIIITGETAFSQVHLMRAKSDAILIGRNTVTQDNPLLTCRLPGMSWQSPARFVLDSSACINIDSALVRSALQVPLYIICFANIPLKRQKKLRSYGCRILFAPEHNGMINLHWLLSEISKMNINTLMVEGGHKIGKSFFANNLVDDIALFRSMKNLQTPENHTALIRSPITEKSIKKEYLKTGEWKFGKDILYTYQRTEKMILNHI